MRAGSIVVTVVLAASLAACTGGGDGNGSGETASSGGQTADHARQLIEASDLSDPATIGALEEIRFTDGGVQAAREVLEGGAEGDALWAATWVYATSGTDPAPLERLLDNADPTVRVLAAAALLSLGEPAAFDALVTAVGSDEPLRGSVPPGTVSGFATFTLTRYTGTDLGGTEGAPAADVQAAAASWAAWLDQHRDDLAFDPSTGMWGTG